MTAVLQAPQCSARENIPFCGPLRGVLNLSAVPIRIEGWFEDAATWAPLVPHVAPASEYRVHTGALWLPQAVILRSVHSDTGDPISVFGAVGEGRRIVQEATSDA